MVTLATIMAIACSGGMDDQSPTPENFCAKKAEIVCRSAERCCIAPAFPSPSCRADIERICGRDVVPVEGASFDAEAATKCLEGLSRVFEPCTPPTIADTDARAALSTCSSLWRRTLPLGANCSTASQCAPRERPDDAGCILGRCTALVARVGEACGTYIEGTVGCEPSAFCKSDYGKITGVCRAKGKNGEACIAAYDDSCVDTQWCPEGVCRDSRPLGSTCGSPTASSRECASPSWCDLTSKTCVSPRNEGDPCDPASMRPTCVGSLACSSIRKLCITKKPDGASCASTDECTRGVCDKGTCTPPPFLVFGNLCASPGEAGLTAVDR